MTESTVLLDVDGRRAVITMNRPDALNALNSDVLLDLQDALIEAAEHEVELLILTGAGKAFVAGADIKEMKDMGAYDASEFASGGQAVLEAVASYPGVTIAAVNGFALGGGMELAMACDFIVAGPKAKFGQPEVKLGVIPGFGGTQRLVRRVGAQRAKELILTGRMIGGDEAVTLGLALETSDNALDRAIELADDILARGPLAVQAAKDCIDRALDVPLAQGLAAEAQAFGLLFSTADQTEGMTAFIEKRDPNFQGV